MARSPHSESRPSIINHRFRVVAENVVVPRRPISLDGSLLGPNPMLHGPLQTVTCATGDCGTGHLACNGSDAKRPVTLIEFAIGQQDYYDLTTMDGFNLPVSISPQGGSGPCGSASSPGNINSVCPPELAVESSDGSVVACKSACLAFNKPQYCCTV